MNVRNAIALLLIASFALLIAACARTTVQRGDYVLVTYTGTFQNGTIFDTNDPALRSSFEAPPQHFTELPVQVGSNQVVPGFENALLGMKEGEKKTVRIKATDAYGGYDPSKTLTIPKMILFTREITMPRTVPTPKQDISDKVGNVTVGQVFETKNFVYNVTGMNSTHVFLYILNETHDPVQLESLPWNSTLVRETPKEMTFEHLVQDNMNYTTMYGPYTADVNRTNIALYTIFSLGQQFSTQRGLMRVTRETSDTVTLDFNHPLAGEDLIFNITVDTIQPRK